MSSINIINLTPHNICLYNAADVTYCPTPTIRALVPNDGAAPAMIFTSACSPDNESPLPLPRCSEVTSPDAELTELLGVDVVCKRYGDVQGLPEPQDGTYYIVSARVADACPDRHDLLIPNGMVKSITGAVIGCTSLSHK